MQKVHYFTLTDNESFYHVFRRFLFLHVFNVFDVLNFFSNDFTLTGLIFCYGGRLYVLLYVCHSRQAILKPTHRGQQQHNQHRPTHRCFCLRANRRPIFLLTILYSLLNSNRNSNIMLGSVLYCYSFSRQLHASTVQCTKTYYFQI